MKINTPVNINITLLKSDIDQSVKIQDVKSYLIDAGADVAGYKDDNDNLVMVVSGNIEYEDIEEAFRLIANVDVNQYIFDDDVDYANRIDLFEKKKSCCPKKRTATLKNSFMNERKQIQRKPVRRVNESKKKQVSKRNKNSGNLVNLYEALHGNYRKPNNKNVTLNEVIDDMTGLRLSESVERRAMMKARQAYIKNKLGDKTYKLVCESLKRGKKSIYPDVKVNNKAIVEYTTNELEFLLEKLTSQIAKIQKKIASLNEADSVRKLHEELEKKNKIYKILDEEISYRKALALREDDEPKDNGEDDNFDFKSLNPNDFQDDDNEEKKDDDSEKEEKEDNDSEEDPDKDTVEELGSIVITLASKEDAEDLKSDCIEAGIPEDVLEVSPVEDEEDEESEENEEETSDEEENKDEAEEKKTEESFSRRYKNRLYEEDEDEETSDNNEEESTDDEEESDGSYKLTLTDTDELPKFKEVLIDKWGVTEDEFVENIGEIVEDDDESEEDKDDKEQSSDEENPDDFDFNPDEIFKDL